MNKRHVEPGPLPDGNGPDTLPPLPWLRGYERTLSGEQWHYHAPHPEAQTAILARATDGRMSIEWETEPVPEGDDEVAARHGSVTFIWMCGLATQKGAHAFTLSADGQPLVTFRTGRDSTERRWTIRGHHGATLRFRTVMVDQFEELFGYMWLTVPRSLVSAGLPLRLQVAAEAGGSPDWHMVFEHALVPSIQAYAEEALARQGDGLVRLARLEVCHLAPPARVAVRVTPDPGAGAPGPVIGPRPLFPDAGATFDPPWTLPLEIGYNAFLLPVPADATRTTISIEEEAGVRSLELPLPPVAARELWFLPHSHVDIGYSDPQPVVERKQWAHLEQAMALARDTRENPAGARFRWNVEVLWAITSWYAQASANEKAAFIEAVRAGEIGLQGTFANVLTGLCHPEELLHLTAAARELARITGVPIDTAMITDIPGATWSLAPALAQGGVRRFSSGPNYLPWHADGGDRIGTSARVWGDRPFWWISPSGEERLLFWMTGRGYSRFHGLNSGRIGAGSVRPILDYLRELSTREHPWSMVQVRYTIGGDNGPPDPDLSAFVRDWNERFASPRLVIATTQSMFDEFERRHGAALPEFRGDLTPYWEDGAASTARETALNRRAASLLVEAAALWSMRRPREYPATEFRAAWREVLLFSEHTWGAAESVSDPDSDASRAQWAWKKERAEEALRRAQALQEAALVTRGASPSIDLLNPTGWRRNDLVLLPPPLGANTASVTDARDQPLRFQRLAGGEILVEAGELPPFAGVRITLSPALPALSAARTQPVEIADPRRRARPGTTADRARASLDASGGTIENATLRARIDGATGAIQSVILKGTAGADGVECVDPSRYPGLNAYLYVAGFDPEQALGLTTATLRLGEQGPLRASLILEGEAPGCRLFRAEIRLAAGSEELEIINTLDKLAVRAKESVHFAFPFQVPDGRVEVDLGWGMIEPDRDQLPGSCRDYFCPHDTVRIEGEKAGVVFASLDAPLVEIGAMTDESPRTGGFRRWRERTGPSTTLFSYAMNNAWHTNYKADQEGWIELRYAIRFRTPRLGRFPASPEASARRFAATWLHPVVAVPADTAMPPPPSLLSPDNPQIEITSLAPTDDRRGWMARLYNPTRVPQDVSLGGALAAGAVSFRSDLDQTRVEPVSFPMRIPPHGIRSLRLEG